MGLTVAELKKRTDERIAAGLIPGVIIPAGPDAPGEPAPLACSLRGGPTGETLSHGGCCGGRGTRVPVLACAKFGKCTESRLFAGVACCRDCDLPGQDGGAGAAPKRQDGAAGEASNLTEAPA